MRRLYTLGTCQFFFNFTFEKSTNSIQSYSKSRQDFSMKLEKVILGVFGRQKSTGIALTFLKKKYWCWSEEFMPLQSKTHQEAILIKLEQHNTDSGTDQNISKMQQSSW